MVVEVSRVMNGLRGENSGEEAEAGFWSGTVQLKELSACASACVSEESTKSSMSRFFVHVQLSRANGTAKLSPGRVILQTSRAELRL